MKDDQELMIKFVKIVERFPEIYDPNSDAYRTTYGEVAWEKVAASVRGEISEECTVDELKVKWKGIRSSYNRYKNKLYSNKSDLNPCKKYYLYDVLRFLDPFVKPKGFSSHGLSQNSPQLMFEDCCKYGENDNSNEYDITEVWDDSDIKPELARNNDDTHKNDMLESSAIKNSNRMSANTLKSKKRKYDEKNSDEDNEDLQFFRSILPDIKDFTTKEKRKLKMGVLQLIDELENKRQQKANQNMSMS